MADDQDAPKLPTVDELLGPEHAPKTCRKRMARLSVEEIDALLAEMGEPSSWLPQQGPGHWGVTILTKDSFFRCRPSEAAPILPIQRMPESGTVH